jgi:precorrin-6B methylase 2
LKPSSSRRRARPPPSEPPPHVSHARLREALERFPHASFPPGDAEERVVVLMLEALELEGSERVLDVAGGSGFRAALLSRLAREVISVEADAALAEQALATLERLGCANVKVIHAEARFLP